eukprot:COSAG03_NODE_1711_length_3618_cov_65.223643_2_plen_39_part_00
MAVLRYYAETAPVRDILAVAIITDESLGLSSCLVSRYE